MASSVTLINLSGYTWGIASNETSVNCSEFRIEIEPELIELLKGQRGTVRGKAIGSMKKTVTMQFEIGGAGGIMAAVSTAAFAPVNSTNYFGAPTTGLYLTAGTVTLNRSGFKAGEATLEAYAGIGGTATVTYIGETDFKDTFTPVAGKSEWGMDTLTRVLKGSAPKLEAYVRALRQGQTFNGFVLQTWTPDQDPVYPEVTLNYKGLTNGIPAPLSSADTIEQSVTVSASGDNTQFGLDEDVYGAVTVASREIQYITRQTVWRYITNRRPTGPKYTGLDVPFDPIIIKSSITIQNTEGNSRTFGGRLAPVALVTALQPVATNIVTGPNATPVPGTPWFECEDRVTRIYQGT